MKKLQYISKKYSYLFPKEKNIDLSKLLISDESIYSISKPSDAEKIIKIIKKHTSNKLQNLIITDGTANVGGDTINFSKYFKKVNAVELQEIHCKALKNNVKVYKRDNVKIYCNNYLDIMKKLKQDIIYLDPPWGGTEYSKKKYVNLHLGDLDISDIVLKLKNNTKFIIIKAPYNFDYKSFFNKIKPDKKNAYLIRNKILILVISYKQTKK